MKSIWRAEGMWERGTRTRWERVAALGLSVACWLAPIAAVAATETADYTVVFEATWSEETHPGELPPSPHFSGLIGGLHAPSADFFEVGQLASEGIERMAETGSKTRLTNEVNDAIALGTANGLLSGGGIGTSPGSVSISFTVHEDFPLLTLVSMLAPSPDWFVGVDSLPLQSAGDWQNEIVIPLHVYDAGTDSGTTFTAANVNTNPADPITLFVTGFFAPPKDLVGTFTITRTDTPPPQPTPVPALAGSEWQAMLIAVLGGLGAWRASRFRRA